jgi:DNA-binding CsgD family transcriptional regulator
MYRFMGSASAGEAAAANAAKVSSYSNTGPVSQVIRDLERVPSFGFLLTRLSIIAPRAAELYSRWSGKVSGWDDGCLDGPLEPPIGAVEGRYVTPRTFLPPDLTLKLAADYEAGATARGLARQHGIHRTTVVRHLRRAGVVTRQRRMADSEALVSRAGALRGEGRSLRTIGAELGISHPCVKRLLDA